MRSKAVLVVLSCLLLDTGAPAAPRLDLGGFALVDSTSGDKKPLAAIAGAKGTLIFFDGTECPVAVAYEQTLAGMAKDLDERGVALVAVSSNYNDAAAKLAAHREAAKLPYPVYQDVDGRLAGALGATRTSEVALLDGRGQVVYQGRVDDQVTILARRAAPTRRELRDAVEAMLAGKRVAVARTQASGCFISRPPKTLANATVTYAKDVEPLVQRYCVAC